MPSPAAPVRLRPLRAAAALVVLLVLAGVVWQAWHQRSVPTGAAEWIWAELPETLPAPVAFYLVRDFEVPPETTDGAPDGAGPRLLVQGDEEYVLHLNGRRLGSNRHRPGAPLDVYPLGDRLLPGVNRLAVELRSARGAGGFLAALLSAEGEPLVVSDDTWRVVRSYAPGLVEGWLVLPEVAGDEAEEKDKEKDAGSGGGDDAAEAPPRAGSVLTSERPVSWGRPPVGRWDRPVAGAPRPLLDEICDGCPSVSPVPPLPPVPARSAGDLVGPDVGDGEEGEAGRAGERAAQRPDRRPVRAVFDFGREVTGYLVVEHPPGSASAPAQVSLFAVGDRPPRLLPADGPAATAGGASALPLVSMPGRALWFDVVPRTFRFAAVAGLGQPLRASVVEVPPAALAELPGAVHGEAEEPGLLGLRPPARRSPAQDRVRRRLESAESN